MGLIYTGTGPPVSVCRGRPGKQEATEMGTLLTCGTAAVWAPGRRGDTEKGAPPSFAGSLARAEKEPENIRVLHSPCTKGREKGKPVQCITAARRKQKPSRCLAGAFRAVRTDGRPQRPGPTMTLARAPAHSPTAHI